MTEGLLYLDSSAILKLVVDEPESAALLSVIESFPDRASSALARVEVHRAVRRSGGTRNEVRRASEVLARIALISVDDDVLTRAAELEPGELRSLDAIHLATALSLGKQLGALAVYDRRLAASAKRLRLRVVSPGQVETP
ncbi:MAG: type II toxin-antitoxin system VapC family toxin [Acidobacteriota bacterium]|nr:type II toxin-antitoxin system VapC family toxin [Acidobacteriota bacterium]